VWYQEQAESGQLSAVSYQLLVVSCQSSVVSFQFAGTARGRLFCLFHRSSFIVHRSSFSLLPFSPPLTPIASFFNRSAAIDVTSEIPAMTKTPEKQAPNAPRGSAEKFQLQR
jgi:hypothetical protein